MKAKVALIDLESSKGNPIQEAIDLLEIKGLDSSHREVALKVGIYHPEGEMYSTKRVVRSIIDVFKNAPRINLVETDNYIDDGLSRLEKVYGGLFSDRVCNSWRDLGQSWTIPRRSFDIQ